MKAKLNYKIIQETANEDYHAFFNGRKWGFIDKKRNTVIKFVFDNVRISAYNPKVYTVIQKEKFGICKTYQNYGLVDSVKGLIVPCKFRCENFKKGKL